MKDRKPKRFAARHLRAVLPAALLSLGLLAGCVGSNSPAPEAVSNPITLGAIEVSALPPAPVQAGAVAPAEQAVVAPAIAAGEQKAAAAAPQAAEAAPPPEAEAPVPVKSAMQLQCESRKGLWAKTPTGMFACLARTRDAGKQCQKEGDCAGQCLARSGTCAPMDPLFGCNDVLDALGRRMTLCLN